jgi:hypothetical protein
MRLPTWIAHQDAAGGLMMMHRECQTRGRAWPDVNNVAAARPNALGHSGAELGGDRAIVAGQ